MGADLVVLDGGDDSPLYRDVKALDRLAPRPDVAAVEQGTRRHPNGVEEDYQRVEFR